MIDLLHLEKHWKPRAWESLGGVDSIVTIESNIDTYEQFEGAIWENKGKVTSFAISFTRRQICLSGSLASPFMLIRYVRTIL